MDNQDWKWPWWIDAMWWVTVLSIGIAVATVIFCILL